MKIGETKPPQKSLISLCCYPAIIHSSLNVPHPAAVRVHPFAARGWKEVNAHILKEHLPPSPSAPPPPASLYRPIETEPCILLFSHSQSECRVQTIGSRVQIDGGEKGRGHRGGGGRMKGDEPQKKRKEKKNWVRHDTHKHICIEMCTSPSFLLPL